MVLYLLFGKTVKDDNAIADTTKS